MEGLVLNSSSGLRLNFCVKLNICTSISATSPSCKALATIINEKTLMKISILIFALFLLLSCKPNLSENIEKPEQTSTDVRMETHENTEVPNKKILGVWTNGASENANFEITPKTFYYVDDFKDYEYTLENDSITINYTDYVYRAKVTLENDTLKMISKDSKAKYWRFKE